MKFIRYLIFTILIIITSCKVVETEIKKTEVASTEFSFKESTYVILNSPSGWQRIFKNAQPTDLTLTELNEIEEILKIAIKKNNEQQKEDLKAENEKHPKNKRTETGYELQLNRHMRQYIPVINENGEKEVWINFFCFDYFGDKWKTQIIKVYDGGNCFFQLKVNLTKKTYYAFRINGYA